MRKHFENVLFVGTGGGNDIFSTLLARWALESQRWTFDRVTIAGVMSPFHQFENTPYCSDFFCPGVCRFTFSSRRYLKRRGYEREVSCIEASVSRLCEQEYVNVESTLGLSLLEGTHGLTSIFYELDKHFDQIFLVDVGGDIFYDHNRDHHILSPMFDSMVLRAFVDSGASGSLLVLGPGVDGEIDFPHLEKSLNQSEQYPLTAHAVERFELLYERYVKSIRPGRTVPMMIEAFQSGRSKIEARYRARNHLGDRRWYYHFNHIIDTRLCKRFYLLDPDLVVNSFAVSCTDPIDWMCQTQVAMRRTNCESSLEYFSVVDGDHERLVQFLMPSPFFDAKTRREIIHCGLTDLSNGVCDECLLFQDDFFNYIDCKGYVPPSLGSLRNDGGGIVHVVKREYE